ncbi:MAG: hypothetical protein V7K98_12370 [Nostoc sp.]|uniref:hypothetical protein n=1 Tax=Nostoc sp. TaxID=1180 RepID=UPI002FF720AF
MTSLLFKGVRSLLPNAQCPMPNAQCPMPFKPPYPNFDNLINKTDAEMQRLGWTTEQGREHLVKYYGKRSRLMLTEEELDNFLLYLQLTDSPIPS